MSTKALIEDRNAKVTTMEAVVNKAKEENRALTDEEKKEFNDLKEEVTNLDATIEADKTVANMTLVKAPEASNAMADTQEAKDIKTFANIIRGIRNEDTPTTVDDGKVTIPTTIWRHIIDKVIEISPIFERADKFYMKGNLVLPYHDRANSTLAVDYAEEFTDLESGKIKLASITLGGFLAGVLAKVSKSLINNSDFDLVGFVEDEIALQLKLWFERQLLFGTSGKIEGLSTIGADMTVVTAAPTVITGDELMDLQDKVIDDYQGNSIWIMNKQVRNSIRKLKDNMGEYLLNRDFTAKWGYSLLGKDVYCSDAMPTLAANKIAIFYGDFSGLAVKISEGGEIMVLREKYYTQHALGVCAWVEADAKLADAQKIARLTTGNVSA